MSANASQGVAESVRSRSATGVVETLCKEIGFPFDPRLERREVLVAFVAELVDEIATMRMWKHAIAERIKTSAPSPESETVLQMALAMLAITDDTSGLIKAAAEIHDFVHANVSDETEPADRLVEMISGCASAIRFGLEHPHMSRHAVDAAQHIWKTKYGVSLFDGCTPTWEKEWTRQKLQSAIIALATSAKPTATTPESAVSTPALSDAVAGAIRRPQC